MALVIADRVLETTATTGTGALALAGAATGYRAFSAACSVADTVYYAIEAINTAGLPSGDWEVGLGTYSAANELTRTTPTASSNAGSAVNFGGGTKRVWIDVTAGSLNTLFNPVTIGAAGSQAILATDAAHVVAQRSGTNAQTFNIYDTFTDASNYRRCRMGWSGQAFSIATEGLGTGVAGDLYLIAGAGKSMFFRAANADGWKVESTNRNFIAETDNSRDIGDATHRPRNLFIAGGLQLKQKAGAVVDGDFTNPSDGMMALDTTNFKIYVRFGGTWKATAALT